MNNLELFTHLVNRYNELNCIKIKSDKAWEDFKNHKVDSYEKALKEAGLEGKRIPSKTEISQLGVMIRKIMFDLEGENHSWFEI